MFRYADPEACPVCRAQIDHAADACPTCAAELTGRPAENLWRTLTHADGLVAELARLAASSTEARTMTAAATPPLTAGPAPFPTPTEPRRTERGPSIAGLTAASVPRILLGLGAGCLLVAALVFLVVAWTSFDQAGRTTTLLTVTAAAACAAYAMVGRSQRAGAEALGTVALGLLVLDLFGADSAGWFGDRSASDVVLLVGTVVAGVGLGAALLVRRGESLPRLVTGEVCGALGLLAATTWLLRDDLAAAHPVVVAIVVAMVAAAATHRLRLPIATGVLALGAGGWWLGLVVVGLVRIEDATVAAVWGDLACWPLLTAAVLALAPTALRVPTAVRVAPAGTGVTLLSLVLVLPVVDEGATALGLVSLLAIVVGVATTLRLPLAWRGVVVVPVAVATVQLLGTALGLVERALRSLFGSAPWSVGPGELLAPSGLEWHQPLLLAPAVLGTLVGACLLARMLFEVGLRPVLVPTGLLTLAPTALLPALYGAPLAGAVGVLLALLAALAVAAGTAGRDASLTRGVALVLALGTAGTALGAALASDVLTAAVTGLGTAALLSLACVASPLVRGSSATLVPPFLAGCLWTVLHLASVEENLRAPVLLLGVGAWALARPHRHVELSAALVGLSGTALALVAPGGADQAWLAVDLTVAGVVVALSALLHPSRRHLGWTGLALLTLAQWVRMHEVGVGTVEAYTLPLAIVLLVVGIVRLRTSSLTSTRALGSGLTLALLPSLLLVLVDPVSLRAVLLGAGCALAIAAGAGMRWSAPLLAGATVGALVVLREATHAQVLPQWVTLAVVGLVLTAVGVTWERRLDQLRLATGFVRRLR